MSEVKDIDLQQMGALRNASQKISQVLEKKLNAYLTTLTPLFAPRKVLGEFMESAFKEKVPGADKNFAELDARFKSLSREAFQTPMKLSTPVRNIKNQLEICPWEYAHALGSGETITLKCPVKWVLAYHGAPGLSRLLKARRDGESLPAEELKTLLVQNLTLAKLLDLSPGIQRLMADLRFPLSLETSAVAGDLPFVVISSPVPTFRPQDELIQTVVQLSGLPLFEELVDVEGLQGLEDPLQQELITAAA
ncbi:MAG TPA: hypothetical protein ENJ19_05245 [Gammaproteobacteria bacterium]|nr:hypothetical protein [Gammaproteobacteria bacterium]